MKNLVNTVNTQLTVFVAGDALSTIKGLLTWFFGAAGIGLIVMGALTLGESFGENGSSVGRRNGILQILGGIFVGACAVLVNLITAPPGS